MLNDVTVKIFDGADEQKVFQKALEGMGTNYTKILSGDEKNTFSCPTTFNFDSRVDSLATRVPEELENIVAALEAIQNLSPKEIKDLKAIQDHLKFLKPQLAKQELYDALACFFYQQRGIFVHSLKLHDHLKM